jgi:iron complex outermembrane receptor protein
MYMKPSLLAGSCLLVCTVPTLAAAQNTPQSYAPQTDEIVVTATPLGRSEDDSLVGVSVVDKEELSMRMAGSVGELLKYEPGVSSTFFGPGASRPIIRGQGGDRIRVLDNGIGSIDASSASPDHAVATEPAMAERVEVIRGSGLLRFGSSGSGGVVNVIDGRIPDVEPDAPLSGAARIGYTSVDEGKEAAFGIDLSPVNAGAVVPVFHFEIAKRSSEDYDIPGFAQVGSLQVGPGPFPAGTVTNSAAESLTIAAGTSLVFDRGFFGMAAKSLDSEYGIPGGDENNSIQLKQFRYDSNGSLEFDTGWFERVDLFAGIADYKHSEIEENGDIGTIFRNQGWETRLELIQRHSDSHQAAYGVQVRNIEFSALGDEAFVPPTDTRQFGLYTFQQIERGNWHLEAAARYETTEHTNASANINRDFDGFSASAGIDRHFDNGFKLGGTIFRTIRAPNSNELFANGPHLATAQFEVGDINLNNEIATGGEIVARFEGEAWSASLNLFRTWYDNFVFGEETGAIRDGLAVFQFRGADAVFQGFELQMDKELGSWRDWDWKATGQLDFVDARLSNANNVPLPRIPPLHGLIGLEAEHGSWSLRGEVFAAAKANTLALNETPTNGYVMLNGFVSVRPFTAYDGVTLRLSAQNLGDVDARQHTSFLKDVVPLPGRSFRFSVEMEF